MNEATILVIRFGRLGDVILAAAASRELRKAFPRSRIDFLVNRAFAGAAALLPGVDRVVPFSGKTPADMVALRHRTLLDRYDLVIDLQGNAKSVFFSILSGPGKRCRAPKETLRRRYLVWRRKGGGTVDGTPVWRRYLRAVEDAGAAAAATAPRIREVSEQGIAGAVAFAPGAGRATKRWPEESFAEAARLVRGRFDVPVLFLGSAEEEAMLTRISRRCGNGNVVFAGESMSKTAALLRDAAVLVTNDSGLLHLSEAAGTPVVALFGPTVAAFGFAPAHRRSIVLERDIPCRPCSLHGSIACPLPGSSHECLAKIQADVVVSAVERFVK